MSVGEVTVSPISHLLYISPILSLLEMTQVETFITIHTLSTLCSTLKCLMNKNSFCLFTWFTEAEAEPLAVLRQRD